MTLLSYLPACTLFTRRMRLTLPAVRTTSLPLPNRRAHHARLASFASYLRIASPSQLPLHHYIAYHLISYRIAVE